MATASNADGEAGYANVRVNLDKFAQDSFKALTSAQKLLRKKKLKLVADADFIALLDALEDMANFGVMLKDLPSTEIPGYPTLSAEEALEQSGKKRTKKEEED